MGWKANKGTVLNFKRGDKGFLSVKLYGAGYMAKPNGIVLELGTTTDTETLITGLQPLVDGVVSSYAGPAGRQYFEDLIVPSDEMGDSVGWTYTVIFDGTNDKCIVFIPNALKTKLDDIAVFLKAQSYKNKDNVSLVVQDVAYKTMAV